ncbi:hypothetical protein GQ44DRAFT_758323 [Phaeosphaeriaceae sp. PMI808]|nr:hypothetical protein GQ44DRAFT_758323 [Phaeosphaeriaceae sp. PMI808]
MCTNRLLTTYVQLPYPTSSASSSPNYLRSSSLQQGISLLQSAPHIHSPPRAHILDALVFDRERLYEDNTAPFTSAPTERRVTGVTQPGTRVRNTFRRPRHQDQTHLGCREFSGMTSTNRKLKQGNMGSILRSHRKRQRTPTQSPKEINTTKKGQPGEITSQKRPASKNRDKNGRFSNVNKTEAYGNMGKKAERSEGLVAMQNIPREVFEVYSSDEDDKKNDATNKERQSHKKQRFEVEGQLDTISSEMQATVQLKRDLKDERQKVEAITQELNDLRQQLQTIKTEQKKMTAEHSVLQLRYTQQKVANEKEQQKQAHKITTLETNKLVLTKELESLKTVSQELPTPVSSHFPTLNPSPPQSFSAETSSITANDRKDDNVRHMYTKTRRQHDILHSSAKELINCTRAMDLASFGEFGRCVEKLKEYLNVDRGVRRGRGPEGNERQ